MTNEFEAIFRKVVEKFKFQQEELKLLFICKIVCLLKKLRIFLNLIFQL